jgi:hypothetical protein
VRVLLPRARDFCQHQGGSLPQKVFISYRRADSGADARSICQRLQSKLGKKNVFIDVDSIDPGSDFRITLGDCLKNSKVMVVVIGPRWLSILTQGKDKQSNESDYVRMEVASALERKLPIIPVLVGGAAMPAATDLSEDLQPLTFRQAFAVRHDSFPRDMSGLEQELRRIIGNQVIVKVALATVMLALMMGAIIYQFSLPNFASKIVYANGGNFACFGGAEFPESWRGEAAICAPYGCNFGKLPLADCLALGARKQSKIVIHGIQGTSRSDECWLQNSCNDLRPHGEFFLFDTNPSKF